MLKCPVCRAATTWQDNPHRPFCSDRCRLIDLGAWMTERYSAPCADGEAWSEEESDGGE